MEKVDGWLKALIEIRKGKVVECPDCKEGTLVAKYIPYEEENDGMIVLRCPICKKGIHMSHQKPL